MLGNDMLLHVTVHSHAPDEVGLITTKQWIAIVIQPKGYTGVGDSSKPPEYDQKHVKVSLSSQEETSNGLH